MSDELARYAADHFSMRELENAVSRFSLDLHGRAVITECASGPFQVTPLIAALAGADIVLALGADGPHGTFADVSHQLVKQCCALGVEDRVVAVARDSVNRFLPLLGGLPVVVTNLRGVRPVDREVLNSGSKNQVVALMYEAWEYRRSDIDLSVCAELGIPVFATREDSPTLRTLPLVGHLAVKLIMDAGAPILGSRVAVIGTGPFVAHIDAALTSLGASVVLLDGAGDIARGASLCDQREIDVLLATDHEGRFWEDPDWGDLLGRAQACGVPCVNLSGLPERFVKGSQVRVHGGPSACPRTMQTTLGALGAYPVINLHAAGLRLGQDGIAGMELGLAGADLFEFVGRSGLLDDVVTEALVAGQDEAV